MEVEVEVEGLNWVCEFETFDVSHVLKLRVRGF
jgi:hypothetical protein